MSKGVRIRYTAKQLAFIKRRRKLPRRALHAAFVRRFRRRDVSLEDLKTLCTRNGWKTGRTGCFEKGIVPFNKGKKMPYNANSARTQFKKGDRTGRANEVYKPIGTERLSKEGYLERKIHDGLPMKSRWRQVHVLNWTAINGPVPRGYCLKNIDGNRLNVEASNWELIPRALLPRLNGRFGRGYDNAPTELRPAIMSVVKLEHQLRRIREQVE